jgi:IS5 family transposase
VTVANKISVIIDVAVDKGVTSLKKFRSAIGEAETASGKMRAGFDVAKESIVANAANIAMAAGGALIAFGVKSVQAFQDTALAAGKFSDATGLAVDEASRFIEVAGDIGIEAGTVEAALGKMNKTLGGSPELFAELGVEIAKTGTGATDVNGTFLNVVDRLNAIKDPAERARVASQLLGKGWQGMAELIGQGSTALKASLAGVGDAQVIDEKELKKAREFRERMDEVNDRLQAVALSVGEAVVPVLGNLADAAGVAADAFGVLNTTLVEDGDASVSLTSGYGDFIDFFKVKWNKVFGEEAPAAIEATTTAIEGGTTAIQYGTDAADEMARTYGERLAPAVADSNYAFDAAAEEANNLAIKTGIVQRAAEALDTAWSNLKGEIDADQAWIDMQTTFDDLKSKGEAAMTAAANGSADARTKMLEFESATNTAKQKIIDLGQQIGLTPTEVKTLLTMTDNGSIEDVEQRLAILTRNRSANVDIIARGGAGYGDRFGGARANGGPVTAGTPYLVGERGPEIVVPGRSGTVIPNNRIGVGGGSPTTVNIYTNADPNSTKAALRRFDRRNGPGI